MDEILDLGFEGIELGYDLTADLVAGVNRRVQARQVTVGSVHNFCPVPVGAPRGHPELFELASTLPSEYDHAVRLTTKTIRFAAEMGATAVVVHCGNTRVRPGSRRLMDLLAEGKRHDRKFERLKMKLLLKREKAARKHLDQLYRAIEELLPVLDETGIRLGIENLPAWESLPTEQELSALLDHFDSPRLCAWHDVGHGRIRQDLGFIHQTFWVEKLLHRTAGMHVHDVNTIGRDHLMPPQGTIDFSVFNPLLRDDMLLVLEPAPGTPAAEISAGKSWIEDVWKEGMARA